MDFDWSRVVIGPQRKSKIFKNISAGGVIATFSQAMISQLDKEFKIPGIQSAGTLHECTHSPGTLSFVRVHGP